MDKVRPKVFLEAAETLGKKSPGLYSPFCCDRLNDLNGWKNKNPYLDLFKEIFEPETHFGVWWSNPIETNEDQEARRLALLFAYEMVKEKQNE